MIGYIIVAISDDKVHRVIYDIRDLKPYEHPVLTKGGFIDRSGSLNKRCPVKSGTEVELFYKSARIPLVTTTVPEQANWAATGEPDTIIGYRPVIEGVEWPKVDSSGRLVS